MAKILRGEVRWADLNPTVGREQTGERPVLILSQDVFNQRSGTVIAMALHNKLEWPVPVSFALAGQNWRLDVMTSRRYDGFGCEIGEPHERDIEAFNGLF